MESGCLAHEVPEQNKGSIWNGGMSHSYDALESMLVGGVNTCNAEDIITTKEKKTPMFH